MAEKNIKVCLSFILLIAVAIGSAGIGIIIGQAHMATAVRASYDKGMADMQRRHGFVREVLSVIRAVKAGEVLAKDNLAVRDYVGSDGLRDRLIQSVELPNVLGRKMRVDLKEKSVLLTTDLE